MGEGLAEFDKSLDLVVSWPANLFAFTSKVMGLTGCYRYVVSPPDSCEWPPTKMWLSEINTIAEEWRAKLEGFEGYASLRSPQVRDVEPILGGLLKLVPKRLLKEWRHLVDNFSEACEGSILDLDDKEDGLVPSLLFLHGIADAAFGEILANESDFGAYVSALASQQGSVATISPDRGLVVPKECTPQVGISLNSLSNHLAFRQTPVRMNIPELLSDYDQRQVDPKSDGTRLNCVLFPWPYSVPPSSFRSVAIDRVSLADNFGFFACDSVEFDRIEFRRTLYAVLKDAQEKLGHVDLVVLPEASIPSTAVERDLEPILAMFPVPLYIAGQYESPVDREFGANSLVMKAAYRPTRIDHSHVSGVQPYYDGCVQAKHHRWRLDKSQIERYGLALDDEKLWWEATKIERRALSLIRFRGGASICPLICEDLARQHPIGELVRCIGPTLVVALLMDGPQLKYRWPAMYAAVLADDPGSSVLTLTSAGAVQLWSAGGKATRREIALWREAGKPAEELAIEENSDALGLVLTFEEQPFWAADGRMRRGNTLVKERVLQIKSAELDPQDSSWREGVESRVSGI